MYVVVGAIKPLHEGWEPVLLEFVIAHVLHFKVLQRLDDREFIEVPKPHIHPWNNKRFDYSENVPEFSSRI